MNEIHVTAILPS